MPDEPGGFFYLINELLLSFRDVIVVVTAALLMQFLKFSKHGSTLVSISLCFC